MANSNAFLPSTMDKKDLLLDTEFCAALGAYPESGCCLRHPTVHIITHEETSEKIVSTCQMCESEFLSDGLRERQSFIWEMMKVQKSHTDERGFQEFKKNWDNGSRISMQSSETKDSEDTGLNINFQADAAHSLEPRRLDMYSQSSILRRTNKHQVAWKEYTWQVILRTTQVQEWALAEKDKEIERLKQKLGFEEVVPENQSLAEHVSSMAPSASEESASSILSDNPTYTQPIAEETPPRVPHRRSSSRFAAQDKSGAASDQPSGAVNLRPPRRQASNDLFEFGSEDEDSDDPELHKQAAGISENSNRGMGRSITRGSKYQARVPPTLPTRQASNEGLMRSSTLSASQNTRGSNFSGVSELTSPSFVHSLDSFVGQESDRDINIAPNVKITGMEKTEMERSYRSYKSKSTLDTIQSEEFLLDHQMAEAGIPIDETPLSGNHRKASVPVSLPERAVVGEEMSHIASVMEEPPPPPPAREDSMQFPPTDHEYEYEVPLTGSSTNQDIRFDASQPETIMESSQDIQFDASQDIKFDASQDIRFDASQDIRFDASHSSLRPTDDRYFRRSSIAEMQFSDKDKLLQEASQALSTPQSYVSKKMRSPDFRRMLTKSKPPTVHLESSDQLAYSERSESAPERNNVRPHSADDIMLANNLKKPPPSSHVPSQLKTPPRQKHPINLGDFLEQNHDGSESYDPEMAEFGDLPVNRGFLRLDGGSSSPVSCVTMLTTEPTSMIGGSVDDDEDLQPNIGLSDGGAKRLLPMEEVFNSDEESSSSDEGESAIGPPKPTIDVVDQIVNDQYGDSGLYTGSVTVDTRIPHGRGVMMYENEREYNGDWSDGRWHGQGEWVNPNGDRYNGTFVFDSRHGEGTYSWRNGNTYKGEFFEDKRQGKGVFTFANGNVYEGDFINGVFEGEGKYTFGNGFYRGSWKGGKYHGVGFLQFNDGSSYSGTFVEGVAHGEGKEISSDGKVTTGFWDQGVAPER